MSSGQLDLQEVFLAMSPGKLYTTADISAILQMPIKMVERSLSDLRDRGVVERVGFDEAGRCLFRRLVKAHVRQEGERPPCPGGRQLKLERKRREQEQERGVSDDR